ncbi:MAG: hypothetical protein ACFFB0_18805 [Promethearchaeota archaeon]
MKKISYSLRIGIVGSKGSRKEIFLDYIKESAIESKTYEEYSEFFLVFKRIPIKTKIFLAEDIDQLIYDFNRIEKLDVLILTINLNDPSSVHDYNEEIINEFNETFSFQGISVLVGMDISQIFNIPPPNNLRISRYNLKKKTKELGVIYCFEIYNKSKDIIEIYTKILDDFIFRFQFSNSDLYEQAQKYGAELLKEKL